MSVEKKNPLKRDQALNDATSGQMGEEPRCEPKPQPVSDSQNTDLREKDWRRRTGRKMSRDLAKVITRARGNVPEMFQKSGRIKFRLSRNHGIL